MTREVAHFQMFEAALETIQPNFPPGVLQADPRYSNTYFNMSSGAEFRGPWNEGVSTKLAETWQFVEDPLAHVEATQGLVEQEIVGTDRTAALIAKMNKDLAEERSAEVKAATPEGESQWSEYALSGLEDTDGENTPSSKTKKSRKK
jgi:Mn-containing catalase